MKKREIAKKLARRAGVSRAEAADDLDRMVRQLLEDLRKQGEATLPGLGKLTQKADGRLMFEREFHKGGPSD